jgi:hypothetical protein
VAPFTSGVVFSYVDFNAVAGGPSQGPPPGLARVCPVLISYCHLEFYRISFAFRPSLLQGK